eukprot:m.48541 g.48541  ORF g.48541 m.48541 type:complete len:81 (+) comp33886_c0_seq6:260-502(+)
MSAKIQECEVSLKRLNEDAVDRSKLLSDMQNDKATISRALIQNKELKSQLEELQEAFVKMVILVLLMLVSHLFVCLCVVK